MTLYRKSHHFSGFTLVEIAIVLVIIGLIIGGILVGKDLITAAQVRMTVAQLERYNSAVNTFKNKYNCLPGDCANATGLGFDVDGDGDGNIGDGDAQPSEILDFWNQLSAANLIDGAFGSSLTSTGLIGTGSPALKLTATANSGVTLWCQAYPVFGTNLPYLHSFAILGGSVIPGQTSTLPINPFYAQTIDQKLDDGLPESGKVEAYGNASNAPFQDTCAPDPSNSVGAPGIDSVYCLSNAASPNQYNITGGQPACLLIVKAAF